MPSRNDLRSRPSATIFLLVALLLAGAPLRAQSVLNTERFEPGDATGFFARLDAGLSLHGGNSDVTNAKGNGALGYRAARSWILAMGGLSYLSSGGSVSVNDQFAQVRYGWFFSERTRTFHFVQIQKSRAQALRHRLLVGSGVRHRFVSTSKAKVDFGAGLMWESERLNRSELSPGASDHERSVRGDLIGVASLVLSPTAKLSDVLYVEPRVDALSDTRMLNEARLAVAVTKGVDLNVAFHWLHDSGPPPSVGRNDLDLSTSLSVAVR